MDGAAPRPERAGEATSDVADRVIHGVGAFAAATLGLSLLVITAAVIGLALPSIRGFGFGFLVGTTWDPVAGGHGALPFLWGTVVTSIVALALAVPIGLGVAVFLTDLGPPWAKRPVGLLVELLSAVPSVVYGLWALLVLAPILRTTIEPMLESTLGFVPLFRGPKVGVGILCASLVLAVMVLPTIATMAREVLRAVPTELREGGLALGATRWDVLRHVVFPHARAGLLGAILLGFGRAVGETMAVAMVVGSRTEISRSLFAPGYTMASVIANEFPEAGSPLHVAALAEIGLVLFALALAFNVGARLLVRRRPAAGVAS